MIAARYAKGTAYRISRHLEAIADFMLKNHLMAVPCRWRTYLVRPNDSNRVGAEFDRRRRLKLPSQTALDTLPMVFRAAIAPADVIFSSVAALLVSAPDRVSASTCRRSTAACAACDRTPSTGRRRPRRPPSRPQCATSYRRFGHKASRQRKSPARGFLYFVIVTICVFSY